MGSIKKILTSVDHTMILNSVGEVYIYGSNLSNQLGTPDENLYYNKLSACAISDIKILPRISFIKSGTQYKTFGENDFKQILSTNKNNVKYPTNMNRMKIYNIIEGFPKKFVVIQSENKEIIFSGLNHFNGLSNSKLKNKKYLTNFKLDLNETILGKKIVKIVGGSTFFIILDDAGFVYGCGINDFGQLLLEDRVINFPRLLYPLKHLSIKDIACGKNHVVFLTDKKEVFISGYNIYGQLGNEDRNKYFVKMDISDIEKIFCGKNNSFFINSKNELFGCGDNSSSQLGLDDDIKIKRVEKLCQNNIQYVTSGEEHSIFVTTDNELLYSGNNSFYQIPLERKKYILEKIKFEV